jgi:hypothetical protein
MSEQDIAAMQTEQSSAEQTAQISEIKPIKTPYNPIVKTFDTADEFNAYYKEHKDEMNKMTTYQLNKTYKIKDLHIAKNKAKEIVLTREYYKSVNTIYKQMCENSEKEYAKKLYNLEENMKQMQQVINQLVNTINMMLQN